MFVPWSADTRSSSNYPKKVGPYRIALANGYIANTLAHQMVRTAKGLCRAAGRGHKLEGIQGRVDRRGRCQPRFEAINNFIDAAAMSMHRTDA